MFQGLEFRSIGKGIHRRKQRSCQRRRRSHSSRRWWQTLPALWRLALLRDAGISVMCLPATDLHLGSRKDETKVRRGLAPVRVLRDGGVNVCLATNNVCNAFTPYGTGDLLQIAALALPACHLGVADDQATVLAMLTTNPAKALRLPSYGVEVGKDADLVLMDTQRVADVTIELPDRNFVVKRGRIVAQTKREVEYAF